MSQKVSRDIPLAEITLRRYEKPYDLKDRELVKKVCLSLGLLQPGDSRDVIVDVLLREEVRTLHAFFKYTRHHASH